MKRLEVYGPSYFPYVTFVSSSSTVVDWTIKAFVLLRVY